MKKIIFLFLVLLVGFSSVQAQIVEQPLSGEFRGTVTNFAYTDENGDVVVEQCVRKIGLIDKFEKVVPITDSNAAPGSSIEDIPTACLAGEHWWVAFEILMKGQREYGDCVARINEQYRRIGFGCQIDDPSCSSIANLVVAVREYWPPFNPIDNFGEHPPGRQSYIAHFGAAIAGVNNLFPHLDACNGYLNYLRGL